jgi:F-type H+-transporting ATPase subunit delta
MAEIKVARRYAKSLLDLGNEQGVSENLFADMQLLLATLKANRGLSSMLRNPIIHSFKKDAVLHEVFGNHMNKVTLAFFKIVTRKSREFYLEDIAKSFVSIYNESKGVRSAKVITAVALDENLRRQLRDIVTKEAGGTVEMSEQIDKNILGGFILRWDDKQVDASVQKQLSDIRKEFAKNLVIKN